MHGNTNGYHDGAYISQSAEPTVYWHGLVHWLSGGNKEVFLARHIGNIDYSWMVEAVPNSPELYDLTFTDPRLSGGENNAMFHEYPTHVEEVCAHGVTHTYHDGGYTQRYADPSNHWYGLLERLSVHGGDFYGAYSSVCFMQALIWLGSPSERGCVYSGSLYATWTPVNTWPGRLSLSDRRC